jgi:magnesium transporter
MQGSSVSNTGLSDVIDIEDVSALEETLKEAHPADIADSIEQITPEKRQVIWNAIPNEITGEVLAELSDGVQSDLAEQIDSRQLIDSIIQLDIDDIADIIPNIPDELLSDVLFAVDQETRSTLGKVLSYPEDSAGGLMDIDATVLRDNISIEVALRFLRLHSNLPSHTDAIYLVNRSNQLTGIVPINHLITAPADNQIKSLTLDNPVFFESMVHEDDVAKAFADYNLISAPVVDDNQKLIGRITVDDVVDVIREQAEADIMASAGLKHEQDIFAPVTRTSRGRAVWLGVNLLTALLGSWVIGQFEGSIQKLVALAVLMPIVASMGGNAGTQTLTVVIRGMSTGTISRSNFFTVLRKESLVGVLNGVLWALVIAIIATLWYQDVALGAVIAIAMLANLCMGAIAGVLLPILLERMNIDPALAGGVALTTVTDVVGYFSVLGLATLFLL